MGPRGSDETLRVWGCVISECVGCVAASHRRGGALTGGGGAPRDI